MEKINMTFFRKTNLVFLLLLTFFTSCEFESKENLNAKSKANPIEDFEFKLKNKPKLFLKYWYGMSEQEYERVSEILIEDGVLGSYRFQYNVVNCDDITIYPVFVSGSLKRIELTGNSCFYTLYKNKYGLPNLKERTYNTSDIFSGDEYDSKNNITELILIESPLIIMKSDIIILIEMKYYKECRKENPTAPFYPATNFSVGPFVFTYKLKTDYLKEEKERLMKIELQKKSHEEFKKQEVERKEGVKNEI